MVESQDIKRLIRYHEGCLKEYGCHLDPASQYLEQKTIEALKELLTIKEKDESKNT